MGRHITTKMVAFIDSKLKDNVHAQELIAKKDARSLMVIVAATLVGIREIGSNRGPLVTEIQSTVGGPDHVAWCMSTVQTVVAYIEFKTGVKSGLYVTESCLEAWEKTDKALRVVDMPLGGAVIIYQHGTSYQGHTGILESTDKVTTWAFEGNTGSGVTPGGAIQREGDGVYHTHRNYKGVGDMHLLGFIKPFEALV